MTGCAAELPALLERYGIAPASQAWRRLHRYLELLRKWQERVNLVGSAEWRVTGALVEEGLWAAGFYPEEPLRHLDIGSGAGFPALVLRIVRPRMSLDMVESRERRALFLENAVRELELEGCRVFHARLDELLRRCPAGGWDCVSWKGLKIAARDLRSLVEACPEGALFYMFHGDRLPLEDPSQMEGLRPRHTCLEFPGKPGWRLSIYGK